MHLLLALRTFLSFPLLLLLPSLRRYYHPQNLQRELAITKYYLCIYTCILEEVSGQEALRIRQP